MHAKSADAAKEPKAEKLKGLTDLQWYVIGGAIGVFCVALVLYGLTMAPTVTFVDSGELILAADGLGVAHPPGFPLYVILAHLATYLPLGNIAVRVHFASALFGALASAMMTLAVAEVLLAPKLSLRKSDKKAAKNAAKQSDDAEKGANPMLTVGPAVLAGLLLATSRTVWAYATIAEVYTLNTLLILTTIWLVFGWRRELLFSQRENSEFSDRKIYVAALVFGLATCVHHVTVGLMLPALAVFVGMTAGRSFFLSRRFAYCALFGIAGLAVYAYLPLAASRTPLMNWGDPDTLQRFIWHITGRQYQTFFDFSISEISEFGRLAIREFGFRWMPAVLVLSAAGLAALYRNARAIFLFLLLYAAADIAYSLSYQIAEDKDAYYLPAFISIVIAAGYGISWMIGRLRESKIGAYLTPAGMVAVLTIIPLIGFIANYRYDNRSQYFVARDYIDNIFRSVEPNGMLLTSDWQVYSPSLYFSHVEHQRQDAVVININQLRRSWYFEYIEQVYPRQMNASREKVGAFLDDLTKWEQDPKAYDRDAAATVRINKRFYEMIMSFVSVQIKEAPVYVTSEIILSRGQDAELGKALADQYKLVPQGLVFRVLEKDGPNDVGEPQLLTRGLGDGTLTFDDDDVVRQKVIPVYLTMALNSGRYLASLRKHERAIAVFRQALSIDPNFEPAKTGLTSSQNALRQMQNKPGG